MSHLKYLGVFAFYYFTINVIADDSHDQLKYRVVGCESSCDSKNNAYDCDQHDVDNTYSYKLFRWDPVKVGYERELELVNGKKHIMVTKSVSPPIFIIENYMEDYECDHLINKAKNLGLYSSEVHVDPKTLKSKDYSKYNLSVYSKSFDYLDFNKDNKINVPEELKTWAYSLNFLYLDDQEVEEMINKFNISLEEDENGKFISRNKFETINTGGIHEYFADLRERHPHHRDRFSEQVWVPIHNTEDKIIDKLMERLLKLTGLHRDIVYGTEPIQIVKYLPHGHYHAHFDSQNRSSFPDFPCCHTMHGGTPSSCRICRYLTALTYLNDVPKGGETAFPVADDENYQHTEFIKRKTGDHYNLSHFCKTGSLYVTPKKGRMVLWYNHHVDENGLLGPLDDQSLHGGCDVIEGEKWIANNWIPAADSFEKISANVYKPNENKTQALNQTTQTSQTIVHGDL